MIGKAINHPITSSISTTTIKKLANIISKERGRHNEILHKVMYLSSEQKLGDFFSKFELKRKDKDYRLSYEEKVYISKMLQKINKAAESRPDIFRKIASSNCSLLQQVARFLKFDTHFKEVVNISIQILLNYIPKEAPSIESEKQYMLVLDSISKPIIEMFYMNRSEAIRTSCQKFIYSL